MNDVVSHIFQPDFNNNTGFFNGQGITIGGVKFTDFSYANGSCHGLSISLSNIGTPRQVKNGLTAAANGNDSALDKMNKPIGMLFVNWNGAVIKNGNFTSGDDIVISDTPEFLAIFNNISSVVYEHVYKESLIENRIPLTVLVTQNVSGSTPIVIKKVGYGLNEKEVADVIYINTGNTSVTLTITNNESVQDNSGCKFKIPNPVIGFTITIPQNGYGEISFVRMGTTIYARGI